MVLGESRRLRGVKVSPPVRALLIALAVVVVIWVVLGLFVANSITPGSH